MNSFFGGKQGSTRESTVYMCVNRVHGTTTTPTTELIQYVCVWVHGPGNSTKHETHGAHVGQIYK